MLHTSHYTILYVSVILVQDNDRCELLCSVSMKALRNLEEFSTSMCFLILIHCNVIYNYFFFLFPLPLTYPCRIEYLFY